jgi:hypothetical protein
MDSTKLDAMELGAYCVNEDIKCNGIRYEELIAIVIYKL